MVFNQVLGLKEVNKDKVNMSYREAVRAVIVHDNKLLMVHSNKGDFKFPGGGANKEENHEATLKREVREETGYIINNVVKKIGVITERRLDKHQENSIFEMISYYYLCKVSDKQTTQELDDYEIKQEFSPVWIGLDEAIRNNEEIVKSVNEDKNPWVSRETIVLNELRLRGLIQ